ncbi:MAG: hypothetical protein ACYC7D_14230 [Nitrososphaerales archaeon]
MSVRDVISPANIVFLLGGLFFLGVAALNEGSFYSVIASVLCFVSIGLALTGNLFFAGPFRVASAVFVLGLVISQLAADVFIADLGALSAVASILLNGAMFILFLGLTLTSLYPLLKHESKEEEEEEELEDQPKKKKKLTYEV